MLVGCHIELLGPGAAASMLNQNSRKGPQKVVEGRQGWKGHRATVLKQSTQLAHTAEMLCLKVVQHNSELNKVAG